ncbi:hypothetical protein HYV64_01165 [Candidatus Shapirobacteria bacterium]|nr:hypothetical protein [Candidatus Shapirobacteria bacterium]
MNAKTINNLDRGLAARDAAIDILEAGVSSLSGDMARFIRGLKVNTNLDENLAARDAAIDSLRARWDKLKPKLP